MSPAASAVSDWLRRFPARLWSLPGELGALDGVLQQLRAGGQLPSPSSHPREAVDEDRDDVALPGCLPNRHRTLSMCFGLREAFQVQLGRREIDGRVESKNKIARRRAHRRAPRLRIGCSPLPPSPHRGWPHTRAVRAQQPSVAGLRGGGQRSGLVRPNFASPRTSSGRTRPLQARSSARRLRRSIRLRGRSARPGRRRCASWCRPSKCSTPAQAVIRRTRCAVAVGRGQREALEQRGMALGEPANRCE